MDALMFGELYKSIPIADNEHFYINRNGTKLYNLSVERFIGISTHAHVNGAPYRCAHLDKNKTFEIHRLVALAWVPNPDPEHKTTVDHIDKKTLNNDADNLRWATPKEQTENSDNSFLRDKDYQLEMSRKGAEKKSKAVEQYDIITGELINVFPSCNAASLSLFGDTKHNSYINRCAHGKVNEVYGYKWKFVRSTN